MSGKTEVQHRHDGGGRHEREHHPTTEPVGECAHRDPAQRSDHHWHRDVNEPVPDTFEDTPAKDRDPDWFKRAVFYEVL
ncbi:hypothetical protein ACWDG1_50355, partial [Streptomyces sp. NPDC001177]